MWQKRWIVLLAVLAIGIGAVGIGGCGDSSESGSTGDNAVQEAPESQSDQAEGPQRALARFLDAMRSGDNEKTSEMLTRTARETAAALKMYIEPPGSDTAEFEIGEVEYVSGDEDGVRIACTLSDLDENSQRQSEEVLWMLRREPEGWRVIGR